MTYADHTAPVFTEHGWGYIGKVSRARDISPNLYWLDLDVVDCGPLGEAVPVARTRHHVSDHVRQMRLGFKTTEIGLRAGQLRAAAYV